MSNVTNVAKLTTRLRSVNTRILCNKTGHLAKVCQSKKDAPTNPNAKKRLATHVVTEQPPVEERQEYSLFAIHDTTGVKDKTDPLFVTVNLNGKQVPMEIDTGSAVTIMSESSFKEIASDPCKIQWLTCVHIPLR